MQARRKLSAQQMLGSARPSTGPRTVDDPSVSAVPIVPPPAEAARDMLEQRLAMQAGEGFGSWLRRTQLERKVYAANVEVVDEAIRSAIQIDLLQIRLTTERVQQDLRSLFHENAVASCGRDLHLEAMFKLEVEAMLMRIEQSVVEDRRQGFDRITAWHDAGDVTDEERDEHLARVSARYHARAEEVRKTADDMIARITAVLQAQ